MTALQFSLPNGILGWNYIPLNKIWNDVAGLGRSRLSMI